MLANAFLGVALACFLSAAVATGHGFREWCDDAEMAPNTTGLVALNLLAALYCLVARSLA